MGRKGEGAQLSRAGQVTTAFAGRLREGHSARRASADRQSAFLSQSNPGVVLGVALDEMSEMDETQERRRSAARVLHSQKQTNSADHR